MIEWMTPAGLHALGCPRSQVAFFEKKWFEGAPLTRETILRAASLGFDIDWYAWHVLRGENRHVYGDATAGACRVYRDAKKAALRVHLAVKDEAWREYMNHAAPRHEAWPTLEAAENASWRVFEDAETRVWCDYVPVATEALVHALGLDGEEKP